MSKTRQQCIAGKVVGSGEREGATSRGGCHGFPPPPETNRTSHEVGINESCPSDTMCAE